VYGFDRGEGSDIAIIDAAGATPRVITNNHMSIRPSISADGKTIAFQSRSDGYPNVYVMDADGGSVRRIAGGLRPAISPDGTTIVFSDASSQLFRVPTAGGTPQKFAERANGGYVIDKQSTRIAYNYWKLQNGRYELWLAVVPLKGGSPMIDMPLNRGGIVAWSPSGNELTLTRAVNGVTNIWSQPFDAKAEPKQLTHFRSGEIVAFDWMADGKLVMTRGQTKSDVVVMRNFR
jgi:Tol biopolymer transport system component